MYRTTTKKVIQRGSLSAVVALGVLTTGIGVAGASSSHHHSSKSHESGFNHLGGVVTAVSATSITVLNKHTTTPVTYTIDATTVVTIGGTAATAANLAVGERVLIVPSTTTPKLAARIAIAKASTEVGNDGLVTAISPTSITLTDDETKAPVTFTIDATTTVTLGGAASAVAAITVGAFVKVLPNTTTSTLAASIAVRAPKKSLCVSGDVTAVSATSITVQGKGGGAPVTFAIDANTKVLEGRSAATAAALAVGEHVRVAATSAAPTTAASIDIELASVAGKVVSVTGSVIVVSNHGGLYQTVDVSATTTYFMGGTSSTLAAVTVGSFIFAEGLVDSTHTILNAITVGIGQGAGAGHHDGFGPKAFSGGSGHHNGGHHRGGRR